MPRPRYHEAMPLETLKEGHRRALQAVGKLTEAHGLIRAGSPDKAASLLLELLPALERDQQVHFRQEEEGLFLYLAHLIGDGPVQAMVGEHESYWKAMATLKRHLEGRANVTELEWLLQHIIYLLQGHIQKEETAYFPLAERHLSPQQLREMDEEMETIARLG